MARESFINVKEKSGGLDQGQDGKVVFVRHRSVFVRVSPNRLQKVNSYLTDENEKKTEHSIEE